MIKSCEISDQVLLSLKKEDECTYLELAVSHDGDGFASASAYLPKPKKNLLELGSKLIEWAHQMEDDPK